MDLAYYCPRCNFYFRKAELIKGRCPECKGEIEPHPIDLVKLSLLEPSPPELLGLRVLAKTKGYRIVRLMIEVKGAEGARYRIIGKGDKVYAEDLDQVRLFLETGSLIGFIE